MIANNKPLHLFVGPSASGKTSVANELEKYGYKQVYSYCTREPRYEGEPGHVFVSKSEFDALENKVAYTEYDNTFYCCTEEQLDEASIYVVDIFGVKTLLERYSNLSRKIKILYFDTNINTRIKRMLNRNDSFESIVNRLHNDEEFNWCEKLQMLISYHQFFGDKKTISLKKINANQDLSVVLNDVLSYMGE